MRTWIKRTLIGIFGVGVLFGGMAACSHHRHGGMGQLSQADVQKLRERIIDMAGRELALDDAQKAKLGSLADSLNAQRLALVAEGSNPRADLQALMAGAQLDRGRAQALIEGKTVAVREKSPAVVAALGDFYDSLKPEQQQKLRDLLGKGSHRHGWRG